MVGGSAPAYAGAFNREGEDFDRVKVSINRKDGFGNTFDRNYARTFAHEFGHLLGLPDLTRPGLMVSGGYVDHLTDADFADAFSTKSIISADGAPPSGPGIKRGDFGYRSAGADLTKLAGSRILGSTNPTLETLRANGPDNFRWVNQVKK